MSIQIYDDALIDGLFNDINECESGDDLESLLEILSRSLVLNYMSENINNNFITFTEGIGFAPYPLFEKISDELYFQNLVNETSLYILDEMMNMDEGVTDMARRAKGGVFTRTKRSLKKTGRILKSDVNKDNIKKVANHYRPSNVIKRIGRKSVMRNLKRMEKEKGPWFAKLKSARAELEKATNNRQAWQKKMRNEARKAEGQGAIKRTVNSAMDKVRPLTVKGRAEMSRFDKVYADRLAHLRTQEKTAKEQLNKIRAEMKKDVEAGRKYGMMKADSVKARAKKGKSTESKESRFGFKKKAALTTVNASYSLDQFDKRAAILNEIMSY